jgi:glycosyltransferase involved in cell wall biosynthesis
MVPGSVGTKPVLNGETVKFSVLIPAYDEEAFIYRCVQETQRVMDAYADSGYEIIVVDDGSQDGTYANALRAAEEFPGVRVVRCPGNLGKGGALRHGFEHARGELVFFLDADLDLHPSQLWNLYRVMNETDADVVVGAKHHPESQLEVPWYRRVMSAGYMLIVRVLFDLPLHDTQTGIKLFRHQVLQRVYPRTQVGRFAFDLEMLVAATRFGYRVVEAPVSVTFERGNRSRIGVSGILRMWWDTLRIFYRASFWRWLSPSWSVKVWLIVLTLGLVLTGIGLGHLLIEVAVPSSLRWLVELLALHSIDRTLRNWIFFIAGLLVVTGALIKLNRYLLAAFARTDRGDLAGIMQRQMKPQLPFEEDKSEEYE